MAKELLYPGVQGACRGTEGLFLVGCMPKGILTDMGKDKGFGRFWFVDAIVGPGFPEEMGRVG